VMTHPLTAVKLCTDTAGRQTFTEQNIMSQLKTYSPGLTAVLPFEAYSSLK